MNLGLLTISALVVGAPAYAVVIPSPAAPIYTKFEWGPLSDDGNMSGTVSTSAAGGVFYVPTDSKLDGQGAVSGQDSLSINFGFTTKQVAFNYAAGEVPSQITFNGGTYYIAAGGQSTLDLYSPNGIGSVYFTAIGFGIDNVFDVGSMYFSNSSQPIFASGLTSLAVVGVPEPATISLLLLGVVAAGVRRRRA